MKKISTSVVKKSICLTAMLICMFSLSAIRLSAQVQAYSGTQATGNNNYAGTLGLDFDVVSTITVSQLGAFDDGGTGLTAGTQSGPNSGIRVAIFNRNTNTIVTGLDVVITGTGYPLSSNFRMRAVTPVNLAPGNYSVVAMGFNSTKQYINPAPAPTTNNGGGLINFVGTGRYGTPVNSFVFPANPDGGPAARYHAGTFVFQAYVANPNAPTVSCPGDVTQNTALNQCVSDPISLTVTATGSPAPTLTYIMTGATVTPVPQPWTGAPLIFNKGVTTVSVTATNSNGSSTCTFTVTINDGQGPNVTCPDAINVPCIDDVPAPSSQLADIAANSSDNCGGAVTITWTGDDTTYGNCLNHLSILRHFKGTDLSGNVTYCTQGIVVNDNVPPVLSQNPANTTISCSASLPAVPVITAIDRCSGTTPTVVYTTTNTQDPSVSSCNHYNYTISRTWTAADVCGNTTSYTQTITVKDNTKPTFTCPANITVYTDAFCGYNATTAATGTPSNVSDNCTPSNLLVPTFSDVTTAGACTGAKTIQRIWSLSDVCGNTAVAQTQTIWVVDNTAPTFTRPADITINTDANCNYNADPSVTGDVTNEHDNCSQNLNATYSDVVTNGPCTGSKVITRTWSLVDNCGNSAANQVQTITVRDNTAPTFTRPADITIYTNASCTYNADPSITGDVTNEHDNCSQNLNATYSDLITNHPCEGASVIARTWSLVDNCGNTAANQVQTITVLDNLPPTFTKPADITIYTDASCNYNASIAVTGDVTNEADNCSTGLQATYTDGPVTPGNCAGKKTIQRTWSLVDHCGNTAANQVQVITILDNTPPTATQGTIAACYQTVAAAQAAALAATTNLADNCSTSAQITKSVSTVGTCNAIVTVTVTDNCGNSTNYNYPTSIHLSGPAEFGNPVQSSSAVQCVANATTPLILPIIKDVCGTILNSTGPVIGGTFTSSGGCGGTVTYQYNYTDCAGWTYFWTYTYTIAHSSLPTIVSGGTPISASVQCIASVVQPTPPVVKDVCGNTLSPAGPVVSGTYTQLNCVSGAQVPTVVYTYTYTDCANKILTWSYTYSVVRTTAPSAYTTPSTSSAVQCAANATEPTAAQLPLVKDVCGNTIAAPAPVVTGTYTSSGSCTGTKLYQYTYTDPCNSSLVFVWTYTYTISHTTNPSEFGGPVSNNATVQCSAQATMPTVAMLPVVKDVCGNVLQPVTFTPVAGGTFTSSGGCSGTIYYDFVYDDCQGLAFNWRYTYNIAHTTAPTQVGGPVSTSTAIQCIAGATTPTVLPVVQDVCGKTIAAPQPVIGGSFTSSGGCSGTVTYQYTYLDCANLAYIWTYTYNIAHTTLPTQINNPPTSSSVQCISQVTYPVLPFVLDVCGNTLVPAGPIVSGTYTSSGGCGGTVVYQYNYSDCAGLPYSWTYTYTIAHTSVPHLVTTPSTGSPIQCIAGAVTPTTLPVVQDVCNNTLTPGAPLIGGTYTSAGCTGSPTVTYQYTYTDCAGKVLYWTYTYTIVRTQAPAQIGGPVSTSSSVQCLSQATQPAGAQLPTVWDACNNTIATPVPVVSGTYSSSGGCGGTKIFTYTYVDPCKSSLTYVWTYTYNISHTTNPSEFGGPVSNNATVQCSTQATQPTVAMLPVVKDVCGNVLQPVSLTPVAGGTFTSSGGCSGTIYYDFVYDDCQGLAFNWRYTYNIAHTTAPTQVGGPVSTSTSVQCVSQALTPSTLPVVQDVCGKTIAAPQPVIGGSFTTSGGCSGTVTYQYTYLDCANLAYIWTYTYNIAHTTAPTQIGSVPTSSAVQCIAQAVYPGLPLVKDVCGNTLAPCCAPPLVGGTFTSSGGCSGTVTYQYNYTDCAGLVYIWTYTYNIAHTTAPAQVGGPVSTSSSIQCVAGATTPTVLPVVQDVCGKVLSPTAGSPVIGGTYTSSGGCSGTVSYTYNYTDCAGLLYIWTYTYNIAHTTAPTNTTPAVPTSSSVQCAANAVSPALPTVKDVCGNTLAAPNPTVTGTYTSSGSCAGSKVYQYIYTDCAGLAYVWTYTYTIAHTTAPAEFGGPVATSSAVQCIASAVAPNLPVVKDVCGNVLTPTVNSPQIIGTYTSSGGCSGTVTYIYTYLDCANLSYSWLYTYNIAHTTAPTNTTPDVPTSSSIQCGTQALTPSLPTVKDVCGKTLTPSAPLVGGTFTSSGGCGGTVTYQYNYTDCAGLTLVWTYTYNIAHTTAPAPTNTVPTSSTIQCVAQAVQPGLPFVQDVCGNTLAPCTNPLIGGTYTSCGGTVNYTYTWTDCAGLYYIWTYTYTIAHTTPPTATGIPNQPAAIQCVSAATAPVQFPLVKDVCGNTLTPSAALIGGTYTSSGGCSGTVSYQYNYTDCAGLVYIWTYTYNIAHTTAPAQVGGPVSTSSAVQCAANALSPALPTVKDVCGNTIQAPNPTVTGTYTSSGSCTGTKIYQYIYTDCAGLAYVWTYTYTISHTTNPSEFGGPVSNNATVQCSAQATMPTVAMLPVVKDVCGNVLQPVTFTPVAGGTFTSSGGCSGTIYYDFVYDDCQGLAFNWRYTYNIAHTTAPTQVGGPVSTSTAIQCIAGATTPTVLPVVQDVCGKTIAAPQPVIGGSFTSSGGCSGTVTYQYTYLDCANLAYIWTYTYNIAHTTLPTQINNPPTSSSVQCISQVTYPVLPFVLDVCGNTLVPAGPIVSGTYTSSGGCGGTVVYQYNYSDCAGLPYSWTYTYTIAHTSVPHLVTTPSTGSPIQCIAGAVTPTTLPVVQDVCNNTLTPGAPLIGGTYTSAGCTGSPTVTYQYTYTDCAGKVLYWTYTYTIVRTQAPAQIGGPVSTSSSVQCLSQATQPAGAQLPTVWDACNNTIATPVPVVSGTYSSSGGCGGTKIFTYTYVDPCKSSLTYVWTYTYNISHTTNPSEFGGPVSNNATVQCSTQATQPTVAMLPVVKDVCGNVLQPVSLTPVAGGTFTSSGGCSGTIYYDFVYDDCQGLAFNWRYTYNIAHTTAPTQVGGPVSTSTSVQCVSQALTPSTLPVVKDVCGKTIAAPQPVIGGSFTSSGGCSGTVTYQYTYLDCANLAYIWTYTYNIAHTTAPAEFGGPVSASSAVQCVANASQPIAAALPVVKDVCGNVLSPIGAPVVGGSFTSSGGCSGTVTYQYTYTDCANLAFIWTYTYNVAHVTPPQPIQPVPGNSSTVQCGTSAVTPTSLPQVYDICGKTISAPAPVIGGTYTSSGGCGGTVTYRYAYTDCAGLAYVWTYTYTIAHTTPPANTTPSVSTGSAVQCIANAVAPSLPTVKDICGNTIAAPAPVIGGTYTSSGGCTGTVTYQYTYTDCAGLAYVWTYTYSIAHTQNPAPVTFPATTSTIQCASGAVSPPLTGLPVVMDACGNTAVLQNFNPQAGGTYSSTNCGNGATITYTYVWDDCQQLYYSWTYTYVINRTQAPVQIGGPVATASSVQCESAATAPSTLPLVKDVCGNTVNPAGPVVGGTYTNNCAGTRTYQYTYLDPCQNNLAYVWTYTYTIAHTTAPAQVGGPVPTSSTVQCASAATPPSGAFMQNPPTDRMNNGGVLPLGLAGYNKQAIAAMAKGVPVPSTPNNGGPTLPVVKDVCGNTLTPGAPVIGGTYTNNCAGTITYQYTYTDCAGLVYIWTYTYNIAHTTPPHQVGGAVPTSSTIQCISQVLTCQPCTILPVVQDVCGNTLTPGDPVISGTYSSTNCGNGATRIYTYTYSDCAGLLYIWTYTYTINRTTPPAQVGQVPVSSSVQCVTSATAPTTLPVVVDVCGLTLSPTGPVVGGTYTNNCAGTRTYQYTYWDPCQNNLSYIWTYTYTIQHTTPPQQIGGPVSDNSNVECITAATPPTVLPLVKDVCGNTLDYDHSGPQVNDNFNGCSGTRTYTYVYDDCQGLPYVWTYHYFIQHVTPPSEYGGPVSTSSNVQCASQATPPQVLPVVHDVCGTTRFPSEVVTVGGTYTANCSGTITYTFHYMDCAGLTFDWTYTYNIAHTTPPSQIGGPVSTSSAVQCVTAATAPTTLPVVRDICNNLLQPTSGSPVVGGTYTTAGGTCSGTRTYQYTYTDCANLSYIWTYTYTIGHTTPPNECSVPPAPTSSTVQCASAATPPAVIPMVRDVCGNTVLNYSGPVQGGTYSGCGGTITYAYTWTDCAGLTFTWTYTYTIAHTTAPVVPVASVATTVQCVSAATAPANVPVVTDVCGNPITPTLVVVDSPIPLTCNGTRSYNYTYTDCAGLTAGWSYVYQINHTTAPVVPANSGSIVQCYSAALVAPATPTVLDVCGNTLTPQLISTSQTGTTCNGTRTYTYRYADCAGLGANWVYVYTYNDNTPPTFTNPGNVTVYFSSGNTYNASPTITGFPTNVGDNCTPTGLLTQQRSDLITQCGNNLVIDRTWKVTDACGNSAVAHQIITVTDNNTLNLVFARDLAQFGASNTINGSVGVTAAAGTATFSAGDVVTCPYTVTAQNVNPGGATFCTAPTAAPAVWGPTPQPLFLPWSGPDTGPSGLNLSNINILSNGTVSGNKNNVTIAANKIVTLTGNNFGIITVGSGAQLTFTSATVQVQQLILQPGLYDLFNNQITSLKVTNLTSVLVRDGVTIGQNAKVNLTGPRLTFYMGDGTQTPNFTVNGGHTQITANVMNDNTVAGGGGLIVNGSASTAADSAVVMTGWYLVNSLTETGTNVTWNRYTCAQYPSPAIIAPPVYVQTVTPVAAQDELSVKAYPNPSTSDFNIMVLSTSKEPVTMRILDMNGVVRGVSSPNLIKTNTFRVGAELNGGTYIAEIIQGRKRATVKLVKLN